VVEAGKNKAVALISGGLDSATAAAVAKADGFDLYAISFDYGQRHAREIDSAGAVARALGASEHLVMCLDLRKIGGSALTDNIDCAAGPCRGEMSAEIPVTYVPARNTIFLAYCACVCRTHRRAGYLYRRQPGGLQRLP